MLFVKQIEKRKGKHKWLRIPLCETGTKINKQTSLTSFSLYKWSETHFKDYQWRVC